MATTEIAGLTSLLENLGLSAPVPTYPEAQILENPLDIGRSYLAEILRSLVGVEDGIAYKAITWPNNIYNGDFSVPLPKLSHEKTPKDLASEITSKYKAASNSDMFIIPIPDGVHLRFIFMLKFLPRFLLPYIKDRGLAYGTDHLAGLRDRSNPDLGKKKVVIEFSSPNIESEFQGKNLRSTIIGSFLSRLHQAMGWDVVRLNYLGDWGKNIALLMVGWGKFGSEDAFKADPVGHMLSVWTQIHDLFQPAVVESKKLRDSGGDPAAVESQGLFAERNAIFKKMEDGDPETLVLWKRFRDASMENYKSLYSRLGTEFEEYSAESCFSPDTMAEVEAILRENNLSEESEGSLIVDMEKLTGRRGGGKIMIRDRNNSQTYALRELANILDRQRQHDFDKMIYVVADDHDTHFSRIFKLLELMGRVELSKKLVYVHFSRVSKMAEKFEKSLKMHKILDRCTDEMIKAVEASPDKAVVIGKADSTLSSVAISGLLAQELVARRAAAHSFDAAKMTAFARSSGPEIQYWYMRLDQILHETPPPSNPTALTDEELEIVVEEGSPETNLLRLLAEYPEITAAAYKSLESPGIVHYVDEVLNQLGKCFEMDEPEGGDDEEPEIFSAGQLAVYDATRQVLGNAMRILGITPVEF
ncbi:arginine-tRNA ligase [Zalerion maritima]|uniref:arginine--tRNA ligase n=1 Tax=Zalerion maritima TaxID=339359 RepID=A0AAD5WV11_9PEZI|nr:arginine-tRNA ligase [Zalerion maritima]